jgi:probable F420-dependent oxidoreductase
MPESRRRFRFGLQATGDDPPAVVRSAREAEDAGFDIFQVGDHVGRVGSALVTLTAAALETTRIRLGTLVLNNDLHHPVTLAQELATLDLLSGGRLEVGLGAGHTFTEYAAMGVAFDPPAVRKERLAEAVEIIAALLTGGPVTFDGRHYRIEEAITLAPAQSAIPLLVGVNGKTALAHAAQHADIVAPTMLGRTLPDGHRHEPRWEPSRLDATMTWIRTAAGERWPSLEIHALVQAVVVTDDRFGAAEAMARRIGVPAPDILETPFVCLGTHEEMAAHLLACRARWGISYFTVRDIDAFAPVMPLVRAAGEQR